MYVLFIMSIPLSPRRRFPAKTLYMLHKQWKTVGALEHRGQSTRYHGSTLHINAELVNTRPPRISSNCSMRESAPNPLLRTSSLPPPFPTVWRCSLSTVLQYSEFLPWERLPIPPSLPPSLAYPLPRPCPPLLRPTHALPTISLLRPMVASTTPPRLPLPLDIRERARAFELPAP